MSLQEIFAGIIPESQLFPQAPMSAHTSFKVGGPAELLIMPQNQEQVMAALKLCREHGVPVLVIGNGSNLLAPDKGIQGVVLKLAKGFDSAEVLEGHCISAQPGILLSKLAETACRAGLDGLAFASGIPGTLGGALTMNAGAYDGEMKDVVKDVTLLWPDGRVETVPGEAMAFGYRTSRIQTENAVVLSATLQLKPGNQEDIKARMLELNRRRAEKQPIDMPSAGSTFKRPEGYFAGKLIMDCGLAGYAVGGAMVSPKHCGFIVNTGEATAKDVLTLIAHVQDKVYKTFGVMLHPEVKILL